MILNSLETPGKDQILAVSKMEERTDLDISHFENNHHFDDTHNKQLLEEQKQLSMASWDIENYLKQTISPHP